MCNRIVLIVSTLAVMALAGCNTVAGLGKDIQKGGAAIQRWAR